MRPLITDVARQCGVTTAVAVCALRHPARISEPVRRLVEQTAADLHFVEPDAWQCNGSGKRTIGVLGLPHWGERARTSYFDEVVAGVIAGAEESLNHVLILHPYPDAFHDACDGRCDGLIVFSQAACDHLFHAIAENGQTAVTIGDEVSGYGESAGSSDSSPGYDFPSVDVDGYGGARVSVEHLIELGHRRIAAVRGVGIGNWADERFRAYCDALAAAGIPFDGTIVATHEEWTLQVGDQVVDKLFSCRSASTRGELPTAIVCPNDGLALDVLRSLPWRGFHVPDDIALVGFDDIPQAASAEPGLTTVRQPMHDIGQRAVALLMQHLFQPETAPRRLVLPAELVVRESTSRSPSS